MHYNNGRCFLGVDVVLVHSCDALFGPWAGSGTTGVLGHHAEEELEWLEQRRQWMKMCMVDSKFYDQSPYDGQRGLCSQ